MERIALVGLGDVGLGISADLLKAGFPLVGFDLCEERLRMLEDLGGQRAQSLRQLSERAIVFFLMVTHGWQIREILRGENPLLPRLRPGSTLVVTATMQPCEIEEVMRWAAPQGVNLVDSPVIGGNERADNGELTLLQAGDPVVLARLEPIFRAISVRRYVVGEQPGQGQKAKAALQALIGCSFTAVFEALVLGAKAGISGRVLYDVFSHSSAASPLMTNCMEQILERRFKGTGRRISTMYENLGIAMSMARRFGVMTSTTASAYELVQAGISLFPQEDNWCVIKLLEQIAGVDVSWGDDAEQGSLVSREEQAVE